MQDGERRQLLRKLLLVRRFEEITLEIYDEGGIPELPHSSIGQEAVGVGGCHPLNDDDIIVPSLRTRAAMLLRIPLEQVVAGMHGTASGPSQGRTTQHHMGSTEYGILGTTGMIGSHLNPSVGTALGTQTLGDNRVTLSFFGDGATTRGEFHTAVNFAAIRNLPVVFLIENNRITEMTPIDEVTAVDDLANFVDNQMPTEIVDGQDVEAVVDATERAVDRARQGDGPSLVEAKTHRFRPHAEAVPDTRDDAELEAMRKDDPMKNYRTTLIEEGICSPDEVEQIDDEVTAQIERAFEFVETDPEPDESAMYHVYKDTTVDPTGVVSDE
jgi:TPP-dependent pyruvate/acetoin dehydrogenase alpha subunit